MHPQNQKRLRFHTVFFKKNGSISRFESLLANPGSATVNQTTCRIDMKSIGSSV